MLLESPSAYDIIQIPQEQFLFQGLAIFQKLDSTHFINMSLS